MSLPTVSRVNVSSSINKHLDFNWVIMSRTDVNESLIMRRRPKTERFSRIHVSSRIQKELKTSVIISSITATRCIPPGRLVSEARVQGMRDDGGVRRCEKTDDVAHTASS
jgi:hypothetical protein